MIFMSNELYHHGVIGMHWGVRRYQNPDGTLTEAGKKRYQYNDQVTARNGDTLDISRTRPNSFQKWVSKKVGRPNDPFFDVYVEGEKVADLLLADEGDSLYVNWLGVNKPERGKGYANALMDYTINFAEENGYEYVILEVPGDSPDARHIYEKKGFVLDEERQKQIGYDEDDVWGGLTAMKRKV